MSPVRQRLGLYFQIYPWNVTAVEMVQYFTELLRHLRGPVVVLLDGGSIHRDWKVVEFCRLHRRLHLERFPAYAAGTQPGGICLDADQAEGQQHLSGKPG